MEEQDQDELHSSFDRRRFLRKAGVTGVLVAWSAPIFQSVALAGDERTSPPPDHDTSSSDGTSEDGDTEGDGSTGE